MKYKIAICKTRMVGSPALILGICRYDETDEFWLKYTMYTMEDYLDTKWIWNPDSYMKNQEACDKESEKMRKMAQKNNKYHGDTVHFNSINKDVKVYDDGRHDFSLDLAEPVELTKYELNLLEKELNRENWQTFDIFDWGK